MVACLLDDAACVVPGCEGIIKPNLPLVKSADVIVILGSSLKTSTGRFLGSLSKDQTIIYVKLQYSNHRAMWDRFDNIYQIIGDCDESVVKLEEIFKESSIFPKEDSKFAVAKIEL